jgi:hypothetical protein
MFAAGPMWTDDEESWEGEGLVIVSRRFARGSDQPSPKRSDAQSGARTFKVRPWMINEGIVTVRSTIRLRNSRFL